MIESRNRLHDSGSITYIELNNVLPHSFATCSTADVEEVAKHRWRLIDGQAVTTVMGCGHEVSVSLPHIITGRHRKQHIGYRDHNRLNATRENIKFPSAKCASVVSQSTLVIGNNKYTIDSTLSPFVAQYNWNVSKKGSPYAFSRDGRRDSYQRIELWRYITGVPKDTRSTVHFVNGDRKDYRRNNLQAVYQKRPIRNSY